MKLTISLAQMDVVTSRPEENLKKGEARIAEAAGKGSDIICFPEMWTTGFNWAENERIVREHERITDRIGQMAARHKIWINGSVLLLDENGKVSNASILFDSEGKKRGVYRKAHLFSPVGEDKHVAAGRSLCTADTPWGLVGLAVCYDIRFPELFRSYALKGVKIVFSPMAFPYPRLEHWKVLVRARAIENQMFVIGTNQVGKEDFGKYGVATYFGDSVIIDPWGETVAEASEKSEELLTATIDVSKVDVVRNKMKVLKDRRPDLYEL
ncbi:carbon-nitrogen family hydrolase [Candidatus Omnitrophota bacterium]